VQGDVSNLADLDRLFATVKQQQGHLDVLFANAGVPALAPLREITEEHFEKVFHINVKGLFFTVQKALPLFTDGGSIILNASIVASKGLESISVGGQHGRGGLDLHRPDQEAQGHRCVPDQARKQGRDGIYE
jgi:NAD(P)-dependent dehydrogenase (short-subunit alcohol dehydrogenase family)